MNRKKYIENDRIYLAECIKSDYKILYDSWHDNDTVWGYNYKLPYSFDEYCEKHKNAENWGAAIIRHEDNEIIGRIGLSAGLPDLTITVFKPHIKQGYGTMAFMLGVKYCFEELKLDKVYAGCFKDNIPSKKMIERCGFKPNPEGNEIEPHIFTGEDRLQLDFVIEKPDFESIKYKMITIRKTEEKDIGLIMSCLKDKSEDFLRQCGYGYGRFFTFPLTAEQIILFQQSRSEESLFFTILNGSIIIGSFELIVKKSEDKCTVARFLIYDEYRSKGYGTYSLKLLTEYAFNKLMLQSVTLGVFDFNESALKCYKKAGFVEINRVEIENWIRIDMEIKKEQKF